MTERKMRFNALQPILDKLCACQGGRLLHTDCTKHTEIEMSDGRSHYVSDVVWKDGMNTPLTMKASENWEYDRKRHLKEILATVSTEELTQELQRRKIADLEKVLRETQEQLNQLKNGKQP